jgi:hypothetical protein
VTARNQSTSRVPRTRVRRKRGVPRFSPVRSGDGRSLGSGRSPPQQHPRPRRIDRQFFRPAGVRPKKLALFGRHLSAGASFCSNTATALRCSVCGPQRAASKTHSEALPSVGLPAVSL